MNRSTEYRARFLCLLAVALGGVLPALLSLRFPPVLGNDFLIQSLSWNHYLRTDQFSRLPKLDPANIAIDASYVLTWWSPGPALLSGLVAKTGLSTGQSLSLWLGLSALLQIFGWKRLYTKLGFDPNTVAWSVLFLAIGWHSLYSFRQFQGGDIFVYALTPWATLAVLNAANRPLRLGIIMGGFTLFGLLLKLSFGITAAAIALSAWLSLPLTSKDPITRQTTVRSTVALALGFLAAALCIKWGFLDQGPSSPGTVHGVNFTPSALAHAAGMSLILPLSSVFSFMSAGGVLCDVLDWPHLEANPGLILLFVSVTIILYTGLLRNSNRLYRSILIGFACIHFAAFAYLYVREAAVSYEDRLFRAAGLILLPGMLAAGARLPSFWARTSLALLFISAGCWGVFSYVYRVNQLRQNNNLGGDGYALASTPAHLAQRISEADQKLTPGNNLFCSTSPELLLAVRRNRIGLLEKNGVIPEYRGTVDSLWVILPENEDASSHLAAFKDYAPDHWHKQTMAGWTIWQQTRHPL